MFAAVVVAGSSSACAGRFTGELDGSPVPPFSSTALATFDRGPRGGGALLGMALPNDSCAGAVDVLQGARTFAQASSQSAIDDSANALTDVLVRVQPEGSWRLSVFINTLDLDFVNDAVVDLDDTDTDIFVSLGLCTSDGIPERTNNNFFDERLDCYAANDGDLELTRNERGDLRLLAIEPLHFVNSVGADDGELAIDVELTTCSAWESALRTTAGNSCFEQCLLTNSPVLCVTNCGRNQFPGGEGEGEVGFD